MKTEPAIIATRHTLNGVKVFLHEDGSLSNRLNFYRGKVGLRWAFRFMDDVCLYDSSELPELLRAQKTGWPKRLGTGRMDSQILQRAKDKIMYDRSV